MSIFELCLGTQWYLLGKHVSVPGPLMLGQGLIKLCLTVDWLSSSIKFWPPCIKFCNCINLFIVHYHSEYWSFRPYACRHTCPNVFCGQQGGFKGILWELCWSLCDGKTLSTLSYITEFHSSFGCQTWQTPFLQCVPWSCYLHMAQCKGWGHITFCVFTPVSLFCRCVEWFHYITYS